MLGLAKSEGSPQEKTTLLTEAESLLVAGYEGMKKRESTIPPQAATRIPESIDRLIDLYQTLDKTDEVEKYRKLRDSYPGVPAASEDKKSPP